ncbi:Pycsar system effector family protein [Streptomyces sp. 029-5]|uniref:Pycsar system effector family protein n=1 Tax=Streptomyces sp. 029-5 TaxID=2789261 RepID=UPI0039807997
MSELNISLAAAHAEVKAEIARTDSKTSLLLAFVGALLAGVWSLATGLRLPLASLLVGSAGVALLVAAAGVLLGAVRPNLGGRTRRPVGFPLWADMSADEVRADLRGQDQAEHIAVLARIAVAKFIRLRAAVDLIRAAGVLLIVAAVIAIGGAL